MLGAGVRLAIQAGLQRDAGLDERRDDALGRMEHEVERRRAAEQLVDVDRIGAGVEAIAASPPGASMR